MVTGVGGPSLMCLPGYILGFLGPFLFGAVVVGGVVVVFSVGVTVGGVLVVDGVVVGGIFDVGAVVGVGVVVFSGTDFKVGSWVGGGVATGPSKQSVYSAS